jgi:type I restriction enzyme R subunit
MANYNESALEQSIIELFKAEGYTHLKGLEVVREKTDVLLRADLESFLRARYGKDGITKNEIDGLILGLMRTAATPVYDANLAVFRMITDGVTLQREDRSQKDLYIEFIDFANPNNNIFKIVNQTEIVGYELRIPDAVVYANGLPLVVLEFKSAVKENTTIENAYTQLTVRYKRDIPELFKYNAFIVISDGVNNKYGSLFAKYDYFYAWRKTDDGMKEVDGINSLYSMVKGLFRKDRLLAVVKDFVFFPDSAKNETKVVCRYPQYFAATKLFDNIKLHMKPQGDGKGGTYFGATGCGKSYTMLYLTRKLMKSAELGSPTIVLITDRTDLDKQLSETFTDAKKFIGDECVMQVSSRDNIDDANSLLSLLKGRASGGVFLTTVQKFTENSGLLSDRTNIICISDEAHRSQVNLEQKIRVTEKGVKKNYGFAKYLHDSFPNATYVGFTGTPIDATLDVFGAIVDRYTMVESVSDGITVNLVYEGRAAKVTLDSEQVKRIEEYYTECEALGANEYQIEESKKTVAKLEAVVGDPDRINAVAADFVEHYSKRVSEGATVIGKAMFVCLDRSIAYNLYKAILALRPEWGVAKETDDGVELTEHERQEIKPMPKLMMVMTRSKDDEKGLYDLLGTKEYRAEQDRQFKKEKSNFKIAIVVDMWLTGFDVPALDTIYIDKPLQKHSLIQTISRVNRVYTGKEKGLIVDYIGIKNSMNYALKQYTGEEGKTFEEVEQAVLIVKDQLEVIARIFHSFNSAKFFNGLPIEQLDCLNRAVEYVQLTKELETRFMAAARRLKAAYNLCVGSDKLTDAEKDYIHFYCAVRAIMFKLTKGEAPDIAQMNARVRKMLEAAIMADGVEELFHIGKETEQNEIDIFSDEYLAKINKIPLANTKIKILQRLLSQAIDEFKRVNKIKGVDFTERLKIIIDEYNDRRKDAKFADEVLDDVAEQLTQLLADLKTEKTSFEALGIDFEEKAFYDILKAVRDKHGFEYADGRLIELAKKIKLAVADKSRYVAAFERADIKAELKVDLIILLDENGYPPYTQDEVYKEVFEQAQNFKKYQEE